MTMQEFIKEHELTMEAQPVPTNPNMSDMVKDSQHYVCSISGPGTPLDTFYSVGPGIVDSWLRETLPKGHVWLDAPCSVDGHTYRTTQPGVSSFGNKIKPSDYRPDLKYLLDCLASDAASVENARNFEEWAGELGYEFDSRSVKHTFRICEQQTRDLRHLLGSRQIFETLLWEVERL